MRCTAFDGGLPGVSVPCQREAVVRLSAMCVHEHALTDSMCARHALVFSAAGDALGCQPCLLQDGGDGHWCPVTVGVLPLVVAS